MSNRAPAPSTEFYESNTNVKWVVLIASVLISVGSIYYTNVLVDQLKERERQQVELFARALEYIPNSTSESSSDINFIAQEILYQNTTIPIILLDSAGDIINHRNIQVNNTWKQSRKDEFLQKELARMRNTYDPIEVPLRDPETDENFGVNYVYYRNSFLLTQLTTYPYIQLSVIAIFAFIAYLAFNYSKVAEQNRVWVGLAKETAHQLGTPLSSLMAWVEVLRDDPNIKNQEIVSELEKDITKLTTVTERFSSIGSVPSLKAENVVTLVNNVVHYLRPRISSKIKIEVFTLSDNIQAMIHAPLFEWVLENLCKNAVDAIGTSGTIAIKILRGSDSKVYIDVSDTGKGIPRSKVNMVFRPGFTTKKRGWGLGLALAKRIIEAYHSGRIFVKTSEENQGTTFRIMLNAISAEKLQAN
jgi:signal transduction histidine kinase